jgi:parallel beta-helix repeat protein
MNRLYCILAASWLLFSADSYGQTMITSVPYHINTSGTYIFAKELVYFGYADAITVNADNVTIDLNGYCLLKAYNFFSATGIYAVDKHNIRIRNGEIIDFTTGIYLSSSTADFLCFGNDIDSVGFQSNGSAVVLLQSSACVVRNCTIIGGNFGVYFNQGKGNRATDNIVNGVATCGLFSSGADYFDSNYADSCGIGFKILWANTTKLRFNTTTNCTTGISGGTSEFTNDQ